MDLCQDGTRLPLLLSDLLLARPPFELLQWTEEFVGPKLEVLEDKTICFTNQNRGCLCVISHSPKQTKILNRYNCIHTFKYDLRQMSRALECSSPVQEMAACHMREWLPKVACRSNLCVTFSPMHYSLGLTGHLYWALDRRSFSLHLGAVIVLT